MSTTIETTFQHRFRPGDTVYVKHSGALVAKGKVLAVSRHETAAVVQVEYRVQGTDGEEVYPEEHVFGTAEEAFS